MCHLYNFFERISVQMSSLFSITLYTSYEVVRHFLCSKHRSFIRCKFCNVVSQVYLLNRVQDFCFDNTDYIDYLSLMGCVFGAEFEKSFPRLTSVKPSPMGSFRSSIV